MAEVLDFNIEKENYREYLFERSKASTDLNDKLRGVNLKISKNAEENKMKLLFSKEISPVRVVLSEKSIDFLKDEFGKDFSKEDLILIGVQVLHAERVGKDGDHLMDVMVRLLYNDAEMNNTRPIQNLAPIYQSEPKFEANEYFDLERSEVFGEVTEFLLEAKRLIQEARSGKTK
jgi:hypothetical protein